MESCAYCSERLELATQFCGWCGNEHQASAEIDGGTVTKRQAMMQIDPVTGCQCCGEMLDSEVRFCGQCGTPQAEIPPASYCPICGVLYAADDAFCGLDGAALIRAGWQFAATPADSGWASTATIAQVHQAASLSEFWSRHRVLLIITGAILGFSALLLGFGGRDVNSLAMLATTGLAVAAAISWPFALAGSDRVLNFVERIDEWFGRSTDSIRFSDSKFRKWTLFPIIWVSGKWVSFSNQSSDPHVAASLRVFGYAAMAMVIVLLAIIAISIMLFILALAAGLWLLGKILESDGDDEDKADNRRNALRFKLGRRGQEIYEGDGSWLSVDKRVGRVGKDGQIYEGDGGWLNVDERVGKIGKDGQIYEGDGGWLSVDERVGKIGKDGQIYEGDGGWLSVDERVGKIDKDGNIYEGEGGWFDTEERVGRSKADR